MFENAVNIQGNSQKSFTGGNQYSEKLLPGVYDVWCDVDVYIKVDQDNASTVTSGTGYLIRAGNTVPVLITSPSYLGASGSATVYFHKVK